MYFSELYLNWVVGVGSFFLFSLSFVLFLFLSFKLKRLGFCRERWKGFSLACFSLLNISFLLMPIGLSTHKAQPLVCDALLESSWIFFLQNSGVFGSTGTSHDEAISLQIRAFRRRGFIEIQNFQSLWWVEHCYKEPLWIFEEQEG